MGCLNRDLKLPPHNNGGCYFFGDFWLEPTLKSAPAAGGVPGSQAKSVAGPDLPGLQWAPRVGLAHADTGGKTRKRQDGLPQLGWGSCPACPGKNTNDSVAAGFPARNGNWWPVVLERVPCVGLVSQSEAQAPTFKLTEPRDGVSAQIRSEAVGSNSRICRGVGVSFQPMSSAPNLVLDAFWGLPGSQQIRSLPASLPCSWEGYTFCLTSSEAVPWPGLPDFGFGVLRAVGLWGLYGLLAERTKPWVPVFGSYWQEGGLLEEHGLSNVGAREIQRAAICAVWLPADMCPDYLPILPPGRGEQLGRIDRALSGSHMSQGHDW